MKKIFSAALSLGLAASLFAQEDKQFRFGPFVTPLVSFTSADTKAAEGTGAQVGINVAMIGEYYFDSNRNYALTAGIGYTIGYGGQVTYKEAGNRFEKREDLSDGFRTLLNGLGNDQPAPTIIRQRMNMVNIPVGFKMRTNELGGTMIRIFAQLPEIGINIVTESKVDAEFELAGGLGKVKVESENYLKNTVPIGVSIGGGLGAEWYPNDKGLGIVAGIFYNNGLFDINSTNDKNRITVNDISLRLGVFF